jgi:GGDEF domain-containing protein
VTGHILEVEQLQIVADALSAHLQPTDMVFRRGTNQLAVLCEGTDLSTVRRAVSEALASHRQTKFALTSVPEGGRSVEQLLATADELLAEGNDHRSSERHSVH